MVNSSVIKKTAFHRGILICVLRLLLGGLFIYSGFYKIQNTAQFQDAVINYEIVPYWIVNITSIILPWIEFCIGFFLISGVLVRACATINCGLLLLFNIAMGINITRGTDIHCGCFTETNQLSVISYQHILFNTFWLLIGIVLFILERRRFSHRFFSDYFTKK